jgi:hypothetical protein
MSFVKKSPQMLRNPFLSKTIHHFYRGKIWATFVIKKKLCPKERIAQRAEISPIWSPWAAPRM